MRVTYVAFVGAIAAAEIVCFVGNEFFRRQTVDIAAPAVYQTAICVLTIYVVASAVITASTVVIVVVVAGAIVSVVNDLLL